MRKMLIGGGAGLFLFVFSFSFAFAAKPADTCKYIKDGTIKDKFGEVIKLGYNKWGYNYQAHMFNGKYCDAYANASWCQQFKDVDLMMKWNDAWLSNKDCGTQGSDQGAYSSLTTPDTVLDRHYPTNAYIGSGAWLTNHATGTYTSSEKYSWDVSGTWNFDLNSTRWGGIYSKTMTIVQDSSGNITGNGSNMPSGNTWTVTGNVVGDAINFSLTYDAPMAGYVASFTGTISGGSMSGTWSDVMYSDSGSWHSTSGSAKQVFETCEVTDFVKIVAAPADAKLTDGKWYASNGTEIGPEIWGSFAIIQEIGSDPCREYDVMNYKSPLRSGLGNW